MGDGQIPYVIEHEIAAIEDCFKKTGMEGMKLTYIIASKSINTRLFRINGGKPTNPPSGTVADDKVTLPER